MNMKKFSVAKADFDVIVYPLCANVHAKGAADLRTTMKILDKLEARSEPDTDAIVDAAVGTLPLYKLTDERAAFRFEDGEALVLIDRLEKGITQLSAIRARVIPGLIDQLSTDVDENDNEEE